MKKLRLREKLSKSNLTIKKRYHYEVISNKEILNKIKPIVAYNIKNIDNDNISFNCNKKTLIEILKLEKDVKVTNLYRNFLYNKIFKKAFFWVGLFIILIIFLLNQIFIRTIIFDKNSYVDMDVYDFVMERTNKVGPYYRLKYSINDLSQDLRTKFMYYAYVGLQKKGAKLYIEIIKQDLKEKEDDNALKYGQVISKYNGRIDYIECTSGNVLVKPNEIIKKGDLLITSNINLDNLYSKEKLVPIKGIVIGTITEYRTIKIPKNEIIEIYSGEFESKTYFELFKNKVLNPVSPYEKSFTKEYLAFQFTPFLKVYKRYFYEKNERVVSHTKDEAQNIALKKIYYDFIKNKTSEREMICSMVLLKYVEEPSDFLLTYAITCKINMGEFSSF